MGGEAPPGDPFDLLHLGAAVGPGAANRRRDVAKLGVLPAASGHPAMAAKETHGPALDSALRAFQRRNGLAPDGRAAPGGPTLRTLGQGPGGAMAREMRAIRRAIPRMLAEDFGELRRWAGGASRGGDLGDLPRFAAEAWGIGPKGRMEMAELIGLVADKNPEQASRLRRAAAARLPAGEQALFAAAPLARALSEEEEAQRIAAEEKDRGRGKPRAGEEEQGTGGKPGAQSGGSGSPPEGDGSQPPASAPPIPKYKEDVFKDPINFGAWMDFGGAVGGLSDVSSSERRAYMEIFAAEGGLVPNGTTVGGIEAPTLKHLIEEDYVKGIEPDTPPAALTMEERTRVYRGYFDWALRHGDGGAELRRIGDAQATAAFADTLFKHGDRVGARIIQKAINDVSPAGVAVDGFAGRQTVDAYRELAADPVTRRALLEALAGERKKTIGDHTGRKGLIARFDHFRFKD